MSGDKVNRELLACVTDAVRSESPRGTEIREDLDEGYRGTVSSNFGNTSITASVYTDNVSHIPAPLGTRSAPRPPENDPEDIFVQVERNFPPSSGTGPRSYGNAFRWTDQRALQGPWNASSGITEGGSHAGWKYTNAPSRQGPLDATANRIVTKIQQCALPMS